MISDLFELTPIYNDLPARCVFRHGPVMVGVHQTNMVFVSSRHPFNASNAACGSLYGASQTVSIHQPDLVTPWASSFFS